MKWTCVKLCLFTWIIKLTVRVSITWPLPSLPIHHVHPYPISWPSPSSSESHPAHHHPFSRMSPALAAVASSVDHHHHHPDPVSEPLPSGLFIPADQVHIYDFVNNYADDGYYDYDDEDSFQEKVRKWRENHHHHRHHQQQQQRSRTDYQSRYNTDQDVWLNSKKAANNKDKQLEGSSSGLDNVAKSPDPLSSNNNKDETVNSKDKSVEFDDDNNRSSKDDSSPSSSSTSSSTSSNGRKELTPGEAKDIESLLEKSEIITGRSASSSSSSSSPPKTLPVEVSRHTITSPNGDMTVVTEMVYKNPYKPTPLPAYSHPPYLPSSRDGLYSPTDDPRLLHHQPSPLPPPPPPPPLPPSTTPSLENFGLGRTTTYLPPPRSSRNRDLATTPWTNGLGRVLPTPPTPFISSTLPTRTSPTSQSSSKSSNKQSITNNNSSNKRPIKQSETNSISKRHEISERSLSAAAIAGIIIGSLVFLALLAGVALFIMYRRPTLPGTIRLRRSTEWVEPQVNIGGGGVGVTVVGGGGGGINTCPPCDTLPVTSSHFTRTQRPVNKISISNTLNRSIDGLLVVGDWTLVSPGSNYETLTKKGLTSGS